MKVSKPNTWSKIEHMACFDWFVEKSKAFAFFIHLIAEYIGRREGEAAIHEGRWHLVEVMAFVCLKSRMKGQKRTCVELALVALVNKKSYLDSISTTWPNIL